MQNTFGSFLKQKRKEKNLTQKELSKLLIVSESAICKWEKDVAHPDITLLPKLSEILGVSEHELITASIDKQSREEKSQAKKWRAFSMTWSLFFYISYIVALIPCFICNLAIDKTLSWFWIVVSALLLSFTFTNLPKLIKKHKLIILPLSMYVALIILLGVCAIYTNGSWFWIASVAVLLGLVIIFTPIYISKYKVFAKIKKHADFVSIGLVYIVLNVLLAIINLYYITNNLSLKHWFWTIALPITTAIYVIINIFLCFKFLKINKLLKTGLILTLNNIILYITPLFIKFKNPQIQYEIDFLNVFRADFSNWSSTVPIKRNIHCIIFLTILTTSIAFIIGGVVMHNKRKNVDNSGK